MTNEPRPKIRSERREVALQVNETGSRQRRAVLAPALTGNRAANLTNPIVRSEVLQACQPLFLVESLF